MRFGLKADRCPVTALWRSFGHSGEGEGTEGNRPFTAPFGSGQDRSLGKIPVEGLIDAYAVLAYNEYIMWRKEDVVKQLQDEQKAKKLSLRSYAKNLRVSPSYLSDVYGGRRDPGPTLLDHLDLERKVVTTVTYVKRRWR
jgi:hypothetical protein